METKGCSLDLCLKTFLIYIFILFFFCFCHRIRTTRRKITLSSTPPDHHSNSRRSRVSPSSSNRTHCNQRVYISTHTFPSIIILRHRPLSYLKKHFHYSRFLSLSFGSETLKNITYILYTHTHTHTYKNIHIFMYTLSCTVKMINRVVKFTFVEYYSASVTWYKTK